MEEVPSQSCAHFVQYSRDETLPLPPSGLAYCYVSRTPYGSGGPLVQLLRRHRWSLLGWTRCRVAELAPARKCVYAGRVGVD